MNFDKYKIAFFSMEIGIEKDIHSYAGGLGILAGDILRSSSDLSVPIIGVSLLYKDGYFKQKIVDDSQIEEKQVWNPYDFLKKLDNKISLFIGDEEVFVSCWVYEVVGFNGNVNHILFLDTDIDDNPPHLRTITKQLYQGDRLNQEIILGIGGFKMLESLKCDLKKYHMNEGHSSFLTLALYKKFRDLNLVKNKCVFTTHTPVAAGHDKFDKNLVISKLKDYIPSDFNIFDNDHLNMTHLGLKFSAYINGVAKKHKKVAEKMFPGQEIEFITNGVHSFFWTCDSFKSLFDKYIPSWSDDPFSLRCAVNIPDKDFFDAHLKAKRDLISEIKKRTNVDFQEEVFTIGFARRFVEYKRSGLIFFDVEKLNKISDKHKIQIVFSGKAHPNDFQGKELLKKVLLKSKKVKNLKVVFLEDYNIEIAKLLISGCDAWLNNPRRPYEASGTSGMKASMNGVPQISTLDGWWLEGHIENVTGWGIGLSPLDPDFDIDESPDDEAEDLYKKLNKVILPMFYNKRKKWINVMKSSVSINGSFFNSHRVVQQYVMEAYFP